MDDDTRKRLDAMMTAINYQHERVLAATERLRVELMARMDRLQDSQTQMRNDTLVNYASVESFDRKMRNQEDQTRLLGEQVSLMFKRILAVDARVTKLEGNGS